MGLHFDSTITLGNVLTIVLLVVAVMKFWAAQTAARRDLEWRIDKLEVWRREHMVDADARDKLLTRLDKMCDHLEYLVKEKMRENEGKRMPREGQGHS